MSKQHIFSFKDRLSFGKYIESSIQSILDSDTQYLRWLIDSNVIIIDSNFKKELLTVLEEKEEDIYERQRLMNINRSNRRSGHEGGWAVQYGYTGYF